MWVYKFLWYVTSPFVHILWLKKVEGKHNVPKKGGVIIAPNHQSFLDPFLITTAVNYRRFYFLTGEFAYKNKLSGWALNKMDFIRVNRFDGDKKAVYDKADRILKNSGALVVFPEGRLTKDGYTQKGFKGVAKMALAAGADIIPTVIKDSYQIYPIHRKYPVLFGRRICQVKFLEPIKFESINNKDLEYIVHELIMKEIAKELGHEYNHTGFDKDIKAEKV